MKRAYVHPNDLKTCRELLTDAIAKLRPEVRAWLVTTPQQKGHAPEDQMMWILREMAQDPIRWKSVMNDYADRVEKKNFPYGKAHA